MNVSKRFVVTLRRLKFFDVDKYNDSFDFDYGDTEQEKFLCCLCNLNEENVLSTEEITEYSSLSEAELAHFDDLLKQEDEVLSSNKDDTENGEEEKFLQEQFQNINKHIQCLGNEKQILKDYKDNLLEEKALQLKYLNDGKKIFQSFALKAIPDAQKKVACTFKLISSTALDLQRSLSESFAFLANKPSILNDMQCYFDEEKKISHYIQAFLDDNFQHPDKNRSFTLNVPGYSPFGFQVQLDVAKNLLKDNLANEIKSAIKNNRTETILQMYKNMKSQVILHETISNQSLPKLEKEIKKLEQLKRKEENLKNQLSNTISEYVEERGKKIASARALETIEFLKFNKEKLQKPFHYQLDQVSRLEIIHMCLYNFEKKLSNVRELIDIVVSLSSVNKKNEYTRLINEDDPELLKERRKEGLKSVSHNSEFISLYRLLNDIQDPELIIASPNHVSKSIETLYEEKIQLEKQEIENVQVFHKMETHLDSISKLNEHRPMKTLESEMDRKLNKLDLKLNALLKSSKTHFQDMEDKNELLQKKRNLNLAKKLFIDAVLSKETFQEHIAQIKLAISQK